MFRQLLLKLRGPETVCGCWRARQSEFRSILLKCYETVLLLVKACWQCGTALKGNKVTWLLFVSGLFLSLSPQVHEVQAPVQVKKNKKKTKTDVKPVQQVSTNDGKEADDGKIQPWKEKFHSNFSFSSWLLSFTSLMFSQPTWPLQFWLASLTTLII